LRYHNRINNLSDDERLIKCAFVEGMHDPAHLFWSHKVHSWLQGQSVGLSIEDDLDVSTVIGNAKKHYAQTWHRGSLSSVARYQPLQPELSQHLTFQQSRASRAENSSADLDVDVMVFMQILVGFCLWHSRCLGSNAIVFSALLVQQRMNIILCLIALHSVPSGTDSQTYFGAQPLHCLLFLLYMIPKS